MPCFDEPSFKSYFTVELEVQLSEHIAISNMPVKEVKEENGVKVYSFERSPFMSCYLLAFFIG